MAARAAEMEESLDAAEQSRRAAVEAYAGWLQHLLGLPWGRRTSEADGEFLYAFRLAPPGARCTGAGAGICSKILTLPYTLRSEGRTETFAMAMEIGVVLAEGGFRQAELSGPDLFSRLYEASEARPLSNADALGRVGAIAWAAEPPAGVLEARLPAARCARDVVSPVVLSRSCDGWSVELVASEQVGQDDRVTLRGPDSP